MATVAEQIQKVYIGLLGRAADKAGLDYWTGEIESGALTLEQLRANIVEEQPEYQNGIGQMTRAQAVNQLYQNLFNRSAEDEGLDYWVNGGGADVSFDQLVLALVDGASAADTLALDNKVQVAQYYTAQAGANYDESGARSAIDGVDGDTDLADARADVDDSLSGEGNNLELTQRADNLTGTDGNDVFTAPVTQDETGSGAVANTFETGDVLDGGEGRDVLNADLTASLSGSVPIAPTISAETDSIEVVNLRAQFPNLADTTIDAEKMSGVEEWWSDNSRSGILVEDIRSNPDDTAFGMRDTDPGVSFASYFNANFLEGGAVVGASAFNFTIRELNAASDELKDITVNGIRFELNGERYQLGGADVEAANTWAELQAALQAEINATEGLENLTVAHRGNGQFVVTDPQSGDFVVDPAGTVISSSTTNEVKDASLGVPQITDLPTETDVFLDGAGNGSQGGVMDVGVMSGSRGVEVFNVNVLHDSHLATEGTVAPAALMSSNLRTGEQYLEEVYVEGEGSLLLGTSSVVAGVSTTTDDRLQNDGLVDVRVFDASGFEQELKLGASLTNNSISRYLDDAEEPVQFTYNLGDGGSNFSLSLANTLSTDNDFMLEINGGAQDDRINLSGNYSLANVSIDGGEGRNTLETSSSIGVDPSSTPTAFENIQKLVLAGNTPINADMTPLAGVEELVVATTGGASSQINDLEADTTVSLSGKNQTLGNQSNASQAIGTINLVDAEATTQRIDLDNTARNSGVLTVADILVTGANSNVDELLLSSNGERDTANVVGDIQAAGASEVTFEGTQNLSANISNLATTPNQALTVDGSALEGDLRLGIDAGLLDKDSTDKLVGTAGDNDELLFDGTFAVDGSGNAKASTNISEFETVTFGMAAGAEGRFDASNTTGVELYEIANLSNDLTVDGLRGTENVLISHTGITEDLALTAGAKATSNTLNAEVVTDAVGNSFGGNLSVDDYRTINLEMNNASDPQIQVNFTPNLVLNGFGDGATATVADINNGDAGSNYARELNLTGGRDGQNTYTGGVSNNVADTLTLNNLTNSLTSIDVSGFKGEFAGSFSQATDSTGATFTDTDVLKELNTNTTITVGEYEFSWDNSASRDTTNNDFAVTTFKFTEDAYTDGVVWQIDGFLQDSGNSQNLDVLDLRGLGIEGVSQLNIEYGVITGGSFDNSGGGLYNSGTTDAAQITHNGDMNFEILLTGLDSSLANGLEPGANFMFA
uniref:DUF4214 domain-containing protein n=1 Tax=Halomonas sp. TaxID=1486246 RepID=UPI003459C1BC